MKHLFIINGLASQDRKKRRAFDQLMTNIDQLRGNIEVQYTQPPEWGAQRLAREAARRGEPVRLYACGGDGTLNEVVCGAAGYGNAAVTNVPLGTGNDFIKIFGKGYLKLFSDLPALMAGPQSAFDLMDCNGRLGLDVVCAGVDARVAADVDRFKALPLVSGAGAYVVSLMNNVFFQDICRPMRVEMGGRVLSGQTAIICICNGRYYGGGFMPVGEAMPDDGVLDMLVVPYVSRGTLLRLLRAYSTGKYRDHPEVVEHFHGREISFASLDGGEVTAVVDGEVMLADAFTVKLSDKKVNFFYPDGAGYAPG